MLALRLILFLVILASAGVIAVGELKLKPLLDDMKDKEKKVTEELGKTKDESSKQKMRAEKAELDRDGFRNQAENEEKAKKAALDAAEDEKKKAAAAAQATAQAKLETADIKAKNDQYFKLEAQGLTPPVIQRINAELPKATNELSTLKSEQRVLMTQHVKAVGELNAFLNPKGAVALPTDLTGKVSAVDPKWDFVVLDIGANHGLLQNGEMTISREGKLIARVKIRKVDTDYAIADVMRGFKIGEIHEGDAVHTPTSMVLPPKK